MEVTTTKGGALTGQERRAENMNIQGQSTKAHSGAALGKQLGVSRQVVVQDIALLRQSGEEIYATNRGYVIGVANARPKRLFKVHHTIEQTGDELNLMVDHGVVVENVIVNHRTYGRLSANLGFRNRRDVARFLNELATGASTPLMNITSGYHFHEVSADSEEVLDELEAALGEAGFLAELTEFEQQYF